MVPIIIDVTKNGPQEVDLLSWEFDNKRTIRLTGKIDDVMADEVRAKLEYLDWKSNCDITVVINSPGGSVTAGLSILDAMKACKSDIKIVCTGIAASMASFLVAVGGTKGKRLIEPNAEMMIHQPLGGAYGQASDVELAANHICKVKKKLNFLLAEATGQSLKQISMDTDRDYYLNAEEAVLYGLVDGIAG